MRNLTGSCCLILALSFLCGPVLAVSESQQEIETVTVTGKLSELDLMTGDLDPLRDHFDGLTGEKIARDIDPLDRYDAFRIFARALRGPLGVAYDWHGLRDDGLFRPTREFFEAGLLCRDFVEETNHHDVEGLEPNRNVNVRSPVILGTACRERDGWHFH